MFYSVSYEASSSLCVAQAQCACQTATVAVGPSQLPVDYKAVPTVQSVLGFGFLAQLPEHGLVFNRKLRPLGSLM